MEENPVVQSLGSYSIGGLLPRVNQRAFFRGAIFADTHLDRMTNQIIMLNFKDPESDNPIDRQELFDFESLLALTSFIHERFHYSQDLFLGFGHLIYELECLLFKPAEARIEEAQYSLDTNRTPISDFHRESFFRRAQVYRLLTEPVGAKWISDAIAKEAPGYDWELLRASSGKELLESYAAIYTYLDLSRRLSVVPEMEEHLNLLRMKNLSPRYRRCYTFFAKAVLGNELYKSVCMTDSDGLHVHETRLLKLALLVMEISLHIPPLETFYHTWGEDSQYERWLQFHPMYRFVALCGAVDHLVADSGGEWLQRVFEAKVNARELASEMQKLYPWWIPYHEITEMWCEYYANLERQGPIEHLRQTAMQLRNQDRILLAQIEDPLRYFDTEVPLIVIANSQIYIYHNQGGSCRMGPVTDISDDLRPIVLALREHMQKQAFLYRVIPSQPLGD